MIMSSHVKRGPALLCDEERLPQGLMVIAHGWSANGISASSCQVARSTAWIRSTRATGLRRSAGLKSDDLGAHGGETGVDDRDSSITATGDGESAVAERVTVPGLQHRSMLPRSA